MAGRDVVLCAEANDSQNGCDKKPYSGAPKKMTMSKHYVVHPSFEYVSVSLCSGLARACFRHTILMNGAGDEGEPGLYV
jgi:hypothetical protein